MSDGIFSPAAIYRTPANAPTEYVCRRLLIPNNLDWLMLLNGALGTLGVTDFYTETDGGLTADETVSVWLQMVIDSMDGCPESTGYMLPISAMFVYPSVTPPANCLLCDGASYLKTSYPELWTALGSAFEMDADYFAVPDLTNKFLKGTNDNGQIAAEGGAQNSFLQITDIPNHEHNYRVGTAAGTGNTVARGNNTLSLDKATATTGWEQTAFTNEPPFIMLAWMIVATP